MTPPVSSSAASPESRPMNGSPVGQIGDPFSSTSSLFAAFQPGALTHSSVQQDTLSGSGGYEQSAHHVKPISIDSSLLSFDFKQMRRDLGELSGEGPLPSGPPSLEKAASYHGVGSASGSPHSHTTPQTTPRAAIGKPPPGPGGPLVHTMSFGPDHTVGLPGGVSDPSALHRTRTFGGFGATDVMGPPQPPLMNGGGDAYGPPPGIGGGPGVYPEPPINGYGAHAHAHVYNDVPPPRGSAQHFYGSPAGGAGSYLHGVGDSAGGLVDPKAFMGPPHAPAHLAPVDVHEAAIYGHAGVGGAPPVALPQQRFYFPGYDGAQLVSLPHQGGAVMAAAPAHHLVSTAGGMGMMPVNQLVTLPNGQMYHVVRAVSPADAHMAAYPAMPTMPFFLHPAAAHLAKQSGYGSSGSDSRDDSPGRHDDESLWRRREREKDKRGVKKRVERDPEVLAALSSAMNDECPSLDEILRASSVHSLSQDQVGCRFLQLKLDEGGSESASVIFSQAKPYLAEMMTDPFGNYLFQKLIEKVSDAERTSVLSLVRDRLVDAALNLHGTRSVQRLVEVCRAQEQIEVMVLALRVDVVRLCVDVNGNHVIQRALQHLGPDDRGFIFDAISQHCVEVSTHRHGCCVMQRCLDAATPPQKRILVNEIARNCLQLMQDPYGNYVVQYVLDRCLGEEIRGLTSCPLGRVATLSVQKYSSNVIEKCLERASEDVQAQLIEEMCSPGNIKHLMQDQYGNYVVQRALSVATHSKGLALVEAIRPHLHSMRNTAGGRRIVAKIAKRFPSVDLGTDLIAPR